MARRITGRDALGEGQRGAGMAARRALAADGTCRATPRSGAPAGRSTTAGPATTAAAGIGRAFGTGTALAEAATGGQQDGGQQGSGQQDGRQQRGKQQRGGHPGQAGAPGAGGLGRAAGLGLALLLSGCVAGGMPFGKGGSGAEGAGAPVEQASSVRLVDRDVEAPEVFQTSDQGLWDGRPSLGGVWVAYPEVTDPERVIIRNPSNGKFVIGALFRRERDMPGPKLQVSSDAAAALGMLAGAPAALQVTALRREEAPADGAAPAPATGAPADAAPAAATDRVTAGAAAAIDRAEARPSTTPRARPAAPAAPATAAAPAAPAPAATPAAAPAPGGLSRPFIQIGIFSVEANANRAAGQMRSAGLAATVKKDESQGKTFWRVIVGPLGSAAERDAAVAKVKGLGYPDAYSVTK